MKIVICLCSWRQTRVARIRSASARGFTFGKRGVCEQLRAREYFLKDIYDWWVAMEVLGKACWFGEWRHFYAPLINHSSPNAGFTQNTKYLGKLFKKV